MKYLKTFEANSNTNLEYASCLRVQFDIKDIFLAEVDEDRFDIIVSSRPVKHHQHQVVVSLNEVSFEDDGHEGFRLGEIKEFLLRLKTYLDSNNFTHTPLSIMIHDGMDEHDHSSSTLDLTEKDIDEVNNWYNTIDAPGLLKVYISITH
jgi:hypothetical protein